MLILGKRLNTENALKYLWKNFNITEFLCLGQFSKIFRVTLKFSVLKFHSVTSKATCVRGRPPACNPPCKLTRFLTSTPRRQTRGTTLNITQTRVLCRIYPVVESIQFLSFRITLASIVLGIQCEQIMINAAKMHLNPKSN